jgi:hypothetical protein
MSDEQPTLRFDLHTRQGQAFNSPATELLYGGAASGGKSFLMRCSAILWALSVPNINIYLFRRLYDDLIKNHLEGPTGFRALLAPFLNASHAKSPLLAGRLAEIVQGEIRFWNGSKIFLCHLQHQKDITKYYGVEIHCLLIEEATQFSEFMIRFLRSRMRMPEALKIPDQYIKPRELWRDPNKKEYLFPRAVYTSNPGGIGHGYIKRSFLEGFKPYELHYAANDDGGHLRQYIPARVDDNPSVDRDRVKEGLSGLPPALVDALLNGNWNAVIGAFFPELRADVHLIKPFPIPHHWMRFQAMDWGACGEGDPFAIGWWAVSDGCVPSIPRNAIICYRRWYGKGLPKVTVGTVADGIIEREAKDPPIIYRVAGGDIGQERGTGPSLKELFGRHGLHFQTADQRRVMGAIQFRECIVGKNGRPDIYWFDECELELETVMNLQHDLNNPTDCTQADDHFYEMCRYALMSRPWVTDKPPAEIPLEKAFKQPTIDELWALHTERNRERI